MSRSVPDDELIDRCLAVAAEICANSPFGTWMTKEVLWSNLEIPSLAAGIDIENRNQIMTSITEDSSEAMQSFLARRPVAWKNRCCPHPPRSGHETAAGGGPFRDQFWTSRWRRMGSVRSL